MVAAGVVLRLIQYSTNRSLWIDEAMLALNILHRSFGGLVQPLDYNQGAPLGFLYAEKIVTSLGGASELALRFVPLLAGVAALLLFRRVVRLFLGPNAAILALALFALSTPLIYYSSEAKQYSTDVFFTVAALWLCLEAVNSKFNWPSVIRLALFGAVAIWFSHPLTLVLAGMAGVLALHGAEWPASRRMKVGLGPACWLASFVVCYFVSLRQIAANQPLLEFWKGYFSPHPLLSWGTVSWLVARFFGAFADAAGLTSALGAALSIAGASSLLRRNKLAGQLLCAPIVAAILAAMFHRYPLGNRLLLYLCPILVLLVAEGAMWVTGRLTRTMHGLARPAGVIVIAALLFQPLVSAVRNVWSPPVVEDIKPDLKYIRDRQRPGDVLYVYHFARYQFWYYEDRESPSVDQFRKSELRIGKDCAADSGCIAADLDPLRGSPRVWILFSHIWTGNGVDEEQDLLNRMDHMGLRIEAFRSTGARAYLYVLSQPGTDAPARSDQP